MMIIGLREQILLIVWVLLSGVMIVKGDLSRSIYFLREYNYKDNQHITNRSLRYEKDNFNNNFDDSLPSLDSWSPFIVNQSCPIFVVESDRKYF